MRPLRDMLGFWVSHSGGSLRPPLASEPLSQPPRLPPAPAQAQIVHAGQACVVKEDNISDASTPSREGTPSCCSALSLGTLIR